MKDLQRFFNNDSLGGVILIVVAVTAMLIANMEITRNLYLSFLEKPIELRIGILEVKKNMLLWINDLLMAIYFLSVGLEIKRELVEGSLRRFQQALFPFIAAVGGMVVPILIYIIFNFNNSIALYGWAIPAATDIAFALGVLALLGKLVPSALKVFLMTLAIIDDIGSMVIIAMFYTNRLSMLSLMAAMLTTIILLVFNRLKIRYISIYLLTGITLWIAVLKSGVHAPLAGLVVGFFVPLHKNEENKSLARILEKALKPWVSFFILPLFAFANAGVPLQNIKIDNITFMYILGIIVGLFVGKPLGVSLFCWLALKLKLAVLPKGIKCEQVMFIGILCGIGFTMSIFISTLAFERNAPEFVVLAKLGVLIGSILAAFFGYILLKIKLSTSKTFFGYVNEK